MIDDLAEEFIGGVVVLRHAVALRIHAGELPGGTDLAIFGGVFIRLDRLILVAALVGGEAELENRPWAGLRLDPGLVVEHLVVESRGMLDGTKRRHRDQCRNNQRSCKLGHPHEPAPVTPHAACRRIAALPYRARSRDHVGQDSACSHGWTVFDGSLPRHFGQSATGRRARRAAWQIQRKGCYGVHSCPCRGCAACLFAMPRWHVSRDPFRVLRVYGGKWANSSPPPGSRRDAQPMLLK